MDTNEIRIEQIDNKGRAFIESDSKDILAAMTFSIAGESLLIIDHTEVDDSLRGLGIGRKLLDEIVVIAEKEDKKILPLCPFAKSVFDKDKSLSHLLR